MRKFTFTLLMLVGALFTSANALTVNDLAGRYVEHSYSGYDYWNWTSWEEFDQYAVVTVSAIDENTIEVYNIYGWECPLTGTVDWETNTITFESQVFGYYEGENYTYTFCGYNYGEETSGYPSGTPVTATIDENGNIEFDCWMIVYDEYTSDGEKDWGDYGCATAYSSLTKTNPIWSAKGNWDAGDYGVGEAQLHALQDGLYILEDLMGGEGLPMLFSVDETSGEIVPLNGNIDGDEYYYYGLLDYYDKLAVSTTYGLSNFEGDNNGGTLSFAFIYYDADGGETEDMYTFSWEPAAINGAKAEAAEADAPVYSLSGIRVAESARDLNKLPKGIYIVNGKKCTVK